MKDDHVAVDVTHEEDEATSRGVEPGDIVESMDPMRRGRVGEDGKVRWFRSTADEVDSHPAEGERWYVAPVPPEVANDPAYKRLRDASRMTFGTDPTPAEIEVLTETGGMTLLDDATVPELIAALEARVARMNKSGRAFNDDVISRAARLAEAVKPQAPPTTVNDRLEHDIQERINRATIDQEKARHNMAVRVTEKAEAIQRGETIDRMTTLDEVSTEMRELGDNFDPETERMTRKQQQVAIANIAYNVHRLADLMKGRFS